MATKLKFSLLGDAAALTGVEKMRVLQSGANKNVEINLLAGLLSQQLFSKSDYQIVAFTKTGNGTAETSQKFWVYVDGKVLEIASGTSITMPTFAAGTDYAIWVKPDGVLEATTNFVSPPIAGSRKIGGFHYAPGGNATAQAGGDTTAQINQYSFWDLKFRPTAPDPRGMTLVAGGLWSDIYLVGVDHYTNGSSKYNVTIADGGAPPKIPAAFGGNGSTAYGNGNWWNFAEVARSYGKRLPSYSDFAALAYGTTENTSSGGSDVPTTGVTGTGATSAWNVFTSKWGVIQSSGCMWTWGTDFTVGSIGTFNWLNEAGGRGNIYQAGSGSIRAVVFGGAWDYTSNSGSRASVWNVSPATSSGGVGARFVCDHLIIE